MHTTDDLIQLALKEDIGPGDITTGNLVAPETRGTGIIIAKQDLVIAGLGVAGRVFSALEPEIEFDALFTDGDRIPSGSTVARIRGTLGTLLKGERTALNFLQRLSGIATQARDYVGEVAGTSVKLVDTRKTTPGWRVLEKYAVRVGGAHNHRMGLYDGVLIKDNHIAVSGGIANAVKKARAAISHLVKIEVEASTQKEVQEALTAGADIIMLDNMDLDQIGRAVRLIDKRALVEVSGGVTRRRLGELARTGVDLISIGALTHSAVAVDLSMTITAN
ncbi:nicotinate-nucleotide diphosphorylase (carboxylating) [Desulfosarcina alkanivorans]|uniref:Probable nicotinate-nucleotide pyrophosphorylase [carboxylating] n=1 Tax=Desulfosarcina alkanivorans TaxID=571177 RepID=A0A5K7YIG4_9BACT|nr:carboxylating nicotinate-nucleotide diphosphorylase [Desulfosarcina alkanivorans]BBO67880.1 nicotinate-nucleotide diphosphorylase (carboxylating) [Desulfosarcina alkanivorans]